MLSFILLIFLTKKKINHVLFSFGLPELEKTTFIQYVSSTLRSKTKSEFYSEH